MRLCWMGIVIACVGVSGCGPDIQASCEAEIKCEGGNDLDIEACVASEEIDEDYYGDIGCADEYDAYFTCIEPLLKCNTTDTGQPCMTDADCFQGTCSGGNCRLSQFGVDPDKRDMCEAEENAFGSCN
ncbi:MAG TPA: hypothetical protein PK156_26495 [Polyangium sp.]|nr:hypothetical protein [Polyangium sp.]